MVTETILSNSYILGITKTKIIKDIYTVFNNKIVNNVTDPNGAISRNKWWFTSFPDYDIENSDYYPIGIINSPEMVEEPHTFGKKWYKFTIDVEVYATSVEKMDDLACDVLDTIETTANTFRKMNLRFVKLDGTDTIDRLQDKIKVHQKVLSFSGQFSYTRTGYL